MGLYEARAGNGTRTRDPNLGKVVLYQLSYSRELPSVHYSSACVPTKSSGDGGERDRTADLLNAIQALSQLSYAPLPAFATEFAANCGQTGRRLP